jgi:hypothetical protein
MKGKTMTEEKAKKVTEIVKELNHLRDTYTHLKLCIEEFRKLGYRAVTVYPVSFPTRNRIELNGQRDKELIEGMFDFLLEKQKKMIDETEKKLEEL